MGYRPRPLFPSAVNLAMCDWSAVAERGPRFVPLIDFVRSNTSRFICSKILFVSAWASFISSSIPMPNCSGTGACDADRLDDTLGPVVGGGGGPELDDAV